MSSLTLCCRQNAATQHSKLSQVSAVATDQQGPGSSRSMRRMVHCLTAHCSCFALCCLGNSSRYFNKDKFLLRMGSHLGKPVCCRPAQNAAFTCRGLKVPGIDLSGTVLHEHGPNSLGRGIGRKMSCYYGGCCNGTWLAHLEFYARSSAVR